MLTEAGLVIVFASLRKSCKKEKRPLSGRYSKASILCVFACVVSNKERLLLPKEIMVSIHIVVSTSSMILF